MKTWSLAGVMDVFKRVERITRPPRRNGFDEDAVREYLSEPPRPPGFYTMMDPEWADLHYGFPYPPKDKEHHVASDGGEWVFNNLDGGEWDAVTYPPAGDPYSAVKARERADALGPYHPAPERFADDTPNPNEPGLDDSELVAVRNLLTAADGTSFETLRRIVRWWLAKPLHERNDKLRCFCPICAPHLHDQSSADGSAQGPADGPAGGVTHSPESSPAGVPLATWLEPAIWTALTDHQPSQEESAIDGIVYCFHPSTKAFERFADWQEWREHVSPDITQRIAAALPDFQK